MSIIDTAPPPPVTVPDDLTTDEHIVWTQPDGAVVYCRVTRIWHDRTVVYLRCSYAGRSWTRRHEGPLFPSMVRRPWTTAELLETIE